MEIESGWVGMGSKSAGSVPGRGYKDQRGAGEKATWRGGRDWSDVSKEHQGFASATGSQERARDNFSLTLLRRYPCQHLGFTLSASRTANKSISVASSQPEYGILFQQT